MHNILVAGLSSTYLSSAASDNVTRGPHSSEKVNESGAQLAAELKSFTSTHLEIFRFDPSDSANWDEFVALVQSRQWDAVSLGGGVRTIPELSGLFTDLVHLVLKEVPGVTLLFPLWPSDVATVIRKYVPEAK